MTSGAQGILNDQGLILINLRENSLGVIWSLAYSGLKGFVIIVVFVDDVESFGL